MNVLRDKDRLFIILLILSSQTQELTRLGPLDLSDLVLGVFFLRWLVGNLMDPEKKTVICFLNLLPLVFLALIAVPMTYNSRVSLVSILYPIKWFLVIFLLVNAVRTREKVFFMVKTFVWVTFFSSVVAFIQFFLYKFTGFILLRKQDPVTMRVRFEETVFGTLFRVSGFFEYIHNLAIVVTIAFLIVLFLFISRDHKLFGKYTKLLIMALMLTALAMTLYKGIWIVLFVSCMLMIYLAKPSKIIHTTALLIAIFVCLHITGITQRVIEIASNEFSMGDFQARLQLDKAGIQKFSLHPVFGIGLFKAPLYTPNAFNLPPHNALILIADELGILGLMTLLVLYGYLFLRLVFYSLQVRDGESKTLLTALTVTFVGFLLYVQVEPSAYNFWCWVYFSIVESCLLFVNRGIGENTVLQHGQEEGA